VTAASKPSRSTLDLLITGFGGLSAVGFAITIWLVFTYVPNDRALFFNQRIFYYHVPHAIMMFLAVITCGVCSLVFLKNRKPQWDDVALAAAEVAVAFGAVALVTGMIWGKAAWGVWWSWEKRQMLTLLLWLTLAGYVLVRRFAGPSADRIAAGLASFGTLTVPFVYLMVDAGDHHPQAGANGNVATLTGAMALVFLLSFLTFLCWFMTLMLSRVASARGEREVRELREKALDAGILT
jgi:heme exporter protein C